MTSKEKEDWIRSRIAMGYTVRQIQHSLKNKFGSGVKNEVIGEIGELIKKEKLEKGNKGGNAGNKKEDTPGHPPPPPKKKKKTTTIAADISITKAELWEEIKSDEDLRGLKTWFTIRPNEEKRHRKGLGDLVIVINELIKKKMVIK